MKPLREVGLSDKSTLPEVTDFEITYFKLNLDLNPVMCWAYIAIDGTFFYELPFDWTFDFDHSASCDQAVGRCTDEGDVWVPKQANLVHLDGVDVFIQF